MQHPYLARTRQPGPISALAVGGPMAGQRIALQRRHRIYEVYHDPMPVSFRDTGFADRRVSIFSYRVEDLWLGPEKTEMHLLVPEHWTIQQAMQQLLDGYAENIERAKRDDD